jgi:hypothetical protein
MTYLWVSDDANDLCALSQLKFFLSMPAPRNFVLCRRHIVVSSLFVWERLTADAAPYAHTRVSS